MGSSNFTKILLVEDNPGDIRLIREAFAVTSGETQLHILHNGDDAIDYLTNKNTSEPEPLPDIVLLDLDLPGKDGCEVLEAIREDPHLKSLPVIILTSSDAPKDIERCYNAHVNAYLAKPSDPADLVSLAKVIESFWCEKVQLPPISR